MLSVGPPDLLLGIIAFVLFSLLGVQLVVLGSREGDRGVQIRLFLTAITLRFLFSILVYQFGLANFLGDEDASGWSYGVFLHTQWTQQHLSLGDLPSVFSAACISGRGRDYAYGLEFYLLGMPDRLVACALNCFCGAWMVLFVYKTAALLFPSTVALRAAWWTCLIPSLITWSALTVKEPIVIVLEAAALYACVYMRSRGFSVSHLILGAGSILLLFAFRFYAPYLTGIAIGLAFLVTPLSSRRSDNNATWLLILVGFILCALVVAQMESTILDQFNLNMAERFRNAAASGGAATGAGSGVETADIRTPLGFLKGVTVGASFLLLAPFPWQLGGASIRMLLTLPEMLFWWRIFFIGVVPGVQFCIRRRLPDVVPLIVFTLGFGLLYSMMFGNIGLVFRQRAQILPWLLIFAAVGVELRRLRETQARQHLPSYYHQAQPAAGAVVVESSVADSPVAEPPVVENG